MYQITGVSNLGVLKFRYEEKDIYIDLSDFSDYRKVSPKHYSNKNNEIILVPEYFNRIVYLDSPSQGEIVPDRDVYMAATQYGFDLWHNINYPNSDNAKVYNKIVNNIST